MGKMDKIIVQIDAFIRKYYKNQMIKGFLLFALIFLSTLLIVSGLEYIGQFNSFVRGVLFFSFLFLNVAVFIRYLAIPILKLFSFGKQISRDQAATIIGDFFPEIKDKLLNTLQLQYQAANYVGNVDFLHASIEQSSASLNKFSFVQAIDFKKNRKFLSYFLPILFVSLLIGIFVPNFMKNGTARILNYSKVYAKEPDFIFELDNFQNLVEQGSNVKIKVSIVPKPGKAVPHHIYFKSSQGSFLMKKENKNTASFELNNITQKITFYFSAEDNQSQQYTIDVVKRSAIGHLDATFNYPAYLKRKTETIQNPGDIIIPVGTTITWNGVAKNVDSLFVVSNDTTQIFHSGGFRFQQKAIQSTQLFFILKNNRIHKIDSNSHQIEVIKDNFPLIDVQKFSDSSQSDEMHFKGKVKDDHGLTRVVFTYKISNSTGKNITKNISVPGISGQESPFSMQFSIANLPLDLNDRLTYYFTVYDNDGIHGPKATKSQIYEYNSPSVDELIQQRSKDKEEAKQSLQELIRQTQSFNNRIQNFRNTLANTKNITWEQKQELKSLENQRQSLQKQLQELQKKMQSSFDKKNKLSPEDQEMIEKQKTLQNLLKNIMDDELKKLLQKLANKLEDNSKRNLLPLLNESKQNSENIEKQMERTMEFLKRLDVAERVSDMQKSLQDLAKKQDSLKQSIQKGMKQENAIKQQKQLNDAFSKMGNRLDSLLKKNNELKSPLSLKGLDSMSNQISKKMQQASSSLQQNQNKQAGKQQQQAAEKMQQMASQLQAQMQSNQQQKHQEDIRAMKQIEENLLRLSFKQEENMDQFFNTEEFDPKYIQLGENQRQIMDNFIPIKDSLEALADRIPKISSFIQQEVGGIQTQFNYIPDLIDERKMRQLSIKQHSAMTHLNNLALFIDESIQSAQQQMRNNGAGKGSCNTPGGKGKSGKSGMSQTLQQLKDMIKQQLNQLGKGPKPGGNQQGNQPGNKNQGGSMLLPINSEKAAKMAAQMAKMQQMIQQLQQDLKHDGEGTSSGLQGLSKAIKDQQKDLINKKWNNELIQRQHQILTRMLQSEKAIKERGFQKKRESKTGKDKDYGNQIQFLEYNKQKQRQIELLKTLDPSFNEYYKNKANDYFNTLNN